MQQFEVATLDHPIPARMRNAARRLHDEAVPFERVLIQVEEFHAPSVGEQIGEGNREPEPTRIHSFSTPFCLAR